MWVYKEVTIPTKPIIFRSDKDTHIPDNFKFVLRVVSLLVPNGQTICLSVSLSDGGSDRPFGLCNYRQPKGDRALSDSRALNFHPIIF